MTGDPNNVSCANGWGAEKSLLEPRPEIIEKVSALFPREQTLSSFKERIPCSWKWLKTLFIPKFVFQSFVAIYVLSYG